MQKEDREDYYTVQEAMEVLAVSRATLERWIQTENIIKYRLPGKRAIFLRKSEIEQLKKYRPGKDK